MGNRSVCFSIAATASFAWAAMANAQFPQVVQLPTFRTFSYSGTVVVPDRGGIALGGISSASRQLNRRALGRGLGSGVAAGQASAHATIIDLRAIDRALLATSTGSDPTAGKNRGISAGNGDLKATEEGKSLVRYARRAFRSGRSSVSFEAYRLAIDTLDGELKQLAIAEFRRVFGTAAEQVVRVAAATK